jgi:hypothetical protein
MAVYQTPGVLHVALASARINYEVADGIVVRGSIPKAQPAALPDGLAVLEVTSPAGWLEYEESGGIHRFRMTTEPVAEVPHGE